MAAMLQLAIVLLAATLANHVLDNPTDLTDLTDLDSLSLVVFVLPAWGAGRVRDPWGTKAAAIRLGAR